MPATPSHPLIGAGQHGALGVGPGMAIGAQIAHPQQRVVHITGDGAMDFNIQGFDTQVRHGLPGQEYPGKGFIPDHDIGIGLVVLEIDIEPGLKLFDQGILQQEGILFGVHNREFDPVNSLYQFMGFVTGKCFTEIAADSFAQMFGLAYIQEFIAAIKIFIDTRIGGNGGCDLLKFGCCH